MPIKNSVLDLGSKKCCKSCLFYLRQQQKLQNWNCKAPLLEVHTFERHVESSELFREPLFGRLDYLHQMSVHEYLFLFYYMPPFLAGSSQQHNAANHRGPVTVPPPNLCGQWAGSLTSYGFLYVQGL